MAISTATYARPPAAEHRYSGITQQQLQEIFLTINILVRNASSAESASKMADTIAKVQTELIARAVELNQKQ